MENIYNTNEDFDTFDFSKLELTKPIPQGNTHLIKFLINSGNPLYVQPPKCTTKQGIVKVGKRYYSDLMFTNENASFIHWIENLELYCHQYIFDNRDRWFDNEMELPDIENYFTSPIKLYKSGQYYTLRSNIQTVLDKPKLKIFTEDGSETEYSTIKDTTKLATIIEIQGIRCSARSFQIDIEIKQIMALKPENLFDTCLFTPINKQPVSDTDYKTNDEPMETNEPMETIVENRLISQEVEPIDNNVEESELLPKVIAPVEDDVIVETVNESEEDLDLGISVNTENNDEIVEQTTDDILETLEEPVHSIHNTINLDGMEEITFNLEELPENDQITLKKRNDVYYELYREARKKAKYARELALASYLEAKNIKNKYMLDDIDDSDDSDLESEYDDE